MGSSPPCMMLVKYSFPVEYQRREDLLVIVRPSISQGGAAAPALPEIRRGGAALRLCCRP